MIFPLDDSSPSPSPSGITQAAVDNALNVASLVFATLVGAAIGFFVALVIAIIVRPIARRSRYFAAIVKRVRTSFYLTALSWGAWIGLQVMLVNTTLSDWSNGGLVGFASHVLLIVSVLTTTSKMLRKSVRHVTAASPVNSKPKRKSFVAYSKSSSSSSESASLSSLSMPPAKR